MLFQSAIGLVEQNYLAVFGSELFVILRGTENPKTIVISIMIAINKMDAGAVDLIMGSDCFFAGNFEAEISQNPKFIIFFDRGIDVLDQCTAHFVNRTKGAIDGKESRWYDQGVSRL